MKAVLYIISVLALITAGYVLYLCGVQWYREEPLSDWDGKPSIVEKFQRAGADKDNIDRQADFPLVREAQSFAGYMNPPQLLKILQKPPSETKSAENIPAARAIEITPKFRLLATCYNRTRPSESVALISEPGREPRWVEKGEPLGHFVVEGIERGSVVYRRGDKFGEMKVKIGDLDPN
ncbi:MAG: hypothetical protein JW715_06895 [Sedimentisphaerales bacterium]|nr:hypothetical protein [Sedimentisphaerales bacterium]